MSRGVFPPATTLPTVPAWAGFFNAYAARAQVTVGAIRGVVSPSARPSSPPRMVYRLVDLPPGTYAVMSEPDRRRIGPDAHRRRNPSTPCCNAEVRNGWNIGRLAGIVLLLLVPMRSLVVAQSTNASLTGRVTDASDAVIVDTRVVAINEDTNFARETTTNREGEYSLTNVPPGRYRLEVEKTGFRKVVKPDVIVHVQDALTLDFELTLGSISDSITVEAGMPLLNTTSASVSTVVNRTFVEELPLNGRSFQALIWMTLELC